MSAADRFVEVVDDAVTNRPTVVIVAFLLVTVVALGGVGGVEQQAGTDQFTADVPAQRALEDIQEEFGAEGGDGFDDGGNTAQLFVSDDNVLSRPALIRVLESQDRLESRGTLRVGSTTSHANAIARRIDPTAATLPAQIRAVRGASATELEAAIADADAQGALAGQLSTDYNPTAQRAGTALVVVNYDVPASASTGTVTTLQTRSAEALGGVDGNEVGENVILFGSGIVQEEILALLSDTVIVVFPAALLFILGFLLIAYRDPIDMALSLAALLMSVLWTFGFMGYVGIPFSDSIITIFPLLLAVGIDFGIHTINRYREERLQGEGIRGAMRLTTEQLTVAFLLVTLTTVFSFLANLVSTLESTRDFGIVAAAGMTFTLLVFAVFLPAAKVRIDQLRERTPIPAFGTTPMGMEGSVVGRLLEAGVGLARVAPVVVVVVVLLLGAAGGAYGTGVDTEFSQEAFFPDEDRLEQYQSLPEPLGASEYTFLDTLTILEEEFDQGLVGSVTLYVDQSVRDDDALELIHRTSRNPPETFARTDEGRAQSTSVVTVIDDYAAQDPEFAALVDRNDRLGNGVPDRNVDEVYDALEESPRADRASSYLAADRGSARIDFTVEPGADSAAVVEDVERISERTPLTTVPTGQLVVQEAVIDALLESAVRSLVAAFLLTAGFLALSYRYLEGRVVYGVINLIPVLATVGLLAGSMRYLGISLTPINAPILSITIGLGVDYTVHFVHRFVDEYKDGRELYDAIEVTLAGTGGALTASMLTTVTGLGVLWLALIPLVQEFGVLIALGVFYGYLCSILLVPSLVVVWDRYGSRVGLGLESTTGGRP